MVTTMSKPTTTISKSSPTPPPPRTLAAGPNHPPNSHKNTHIQAFIDSAIETTNPSLRHLASHSSLGSQRSNRTHGSQKTWRSPRSQIHPLSTTFEEQRHPGKPTLSLTKNTKFYDPEAKQAGAYGFEGHGTGKGRINGSLSSTYQKHRKLGSVSGSANYASDETTLFSDPRSSVADYAVGGSESQEFRSYKEIEIGVPPAKPQEGENEGEVEKEEGEEGENNYPGPLGLFILITGIALSVFLISLDRTIITTAIPFISNEFQSYDDIGWYGSAYLLTASAFQPLYGRLYMLFNMKWTYLVSLSMFELGSLICGVAPNSVALIIGRAIAGLGSAGILTGSFVVVSHAVPLARRPVLTAVVGLMFGVGATAGPLLGGVFTDLVTWRWCFYFNLPVGGATVFAMLLYFHPPKKHALMGKSFPYRTLELDLVGNMILLGASIMLFLALQYTEQQIPWSSAQVSGLLTGSGLTFIAFCIWQWWKQDGALMPPRILRQRTVAAACAAGFFIYSTILVQTYYLPMWFQAVKGDSAILSGVNMIPYVVANALFSLLAGIFVSKNGYFTAPAIIGMTIGTVGSGLISTIGPNTSLSKWIGYEILASTGIGMAIQQGFTAVQIVLPLDEVAIGTAAVVAFQSLGGAVFVSVGNTILQNSLISAANHNELPGVDIQAVIDAGAADFRKHVTSEQLPALLDVYNRALQKVFVAAIPMAGLAVLACACMEWRNVKDQRKSDEEVARKATRVRSEMEKAIVVRYRNSAMSGSTVG